MDKQAHKPLHTDSTTPTTPSAAAGIPNGFAMVTGNQGEPHLVPEFLVPATHQAFEGYCKRMELDISKESGGVHLKFNLLS